MLWQQAMTEVPAVLPANILEFCPEMSPGALNANCTTAAQPPVPAPGAEPKSLSCVPSCQGKAVVKPN